MTLQPSQHSRPLGAELGKVNVRCHHLYTASPGPLVCSVCFHSAPAHKPSPLCRGVAFVPCNNTLLLMSHKPGLNTMASKGSVSAHGAGGLVQL